GLLVSHCVAGARFAHLPWALLHTPVEQRMFTRDDILASAMGVDLCVVLAALVRDCTGLERCEHDESRLHTLGAALERIASQSPEQASASMRDAVMRLTTCHAQALAARAREHEDRVGWARDVAKFLQMWRVATRRADYHVPVECLPGTDGAGALMRLLG